MPRRGGVVVGLLCLLALVLAIVALSRAGRNADRIDRLAAEVAELRGLGEKPPPVAEPERAAPPPAPVVEPWQPPPAPPPAVAAPPRASIRIDWERWFGVRAAAVLGGVALALAGLLFFKYSIEHGLIPPWLRVVVGTLAGIACIVGAEWSLRRRYAGTANALAGAGVVVLYAAFWAAGVRYGLVPIAVSFVLMVAVTAACAALSWRHASQVIALIGLIGGFATPLLLSTGADRPLGLFGYALLLDLGLLFLARQRRWPRLALLSLAGTLLYEVLWVGAHMGPDRVFLGLGIVAVFALLFALAPGRAAAEDRAEWLSVQAGGVLAPFAFALYLASRASFAEHLHPVALLLLLLSVAAGWIGRMQRAYSIARGAAAAIVAVVAVWLLTRTAGVGLAWEASVWCVALALVFHGFVEWEPERAGSDGPAPAAMTASFGFLGLLAVGAVGTIGAEPWPWFLGVGGLAALIVRHGGFRGREYLQVAAAVGVVVTVAAFEHAHGGSPGFPPLALHLGVLLGIALAFQMVAVVRRAAEPRRWAEHAAGVLAALLLAHLATSPSGVVPSPWLVLGTMGALGLLIALVAARLGDGRWLLVAVLATAVAEARWTFAAGFGPVAVPALALQGAAVLVFTGWPFVAAARFGAEPFAWRAAALAAPVWFLSLKQLFEARFGDAAIGLLPVCLALVSFAAAARTRRLWPPSAPLRTMSLAWFAAAAMGFITVAVPLQLEKEWITIGWALEGLAVTALWVRLDHPGLKYFGLALLAGATVRLVVNPAVLGYYPRPAFRIVNWLMYTYLVPAAALLVSSTILQAHEVVRLRDWERTRWYGAARPLAAFATGAAGLLVVFMWINLAIADWFATGPTLSVSFERLPARDLATSLAWAVYALVLLAVGMGRGRIGLRWASLALLLVTIAKVFLHDLGELRDLYRVGSLLGLALSLIGVSLAYQRFVFREVPAEET